MITGLQTRRLDREYETLCKMTSLEADPRLSEAASLLVLAQTGVALDEVSVHKMMSNLEKLADEHDVSPDILQTALHRNEPVLMEER